MSAADVYSIRDQVPLYYIRIRGGAPVTGLSVSVVVYNAITGATLLASTALAEQVVGGGYYLYLWTHGLFQDTECRAIYTVGSLIYTETFTITNNLLSGRTA